MASTPSDRRTFGERLGELIDTSGLSQSDIGTALAEHGGTAVSGSAVSEWKRGKSAPDFVQVRALERVLGEPEGALAGLLGYRGDDPAVLARLTQLEERVGRQDDRLDQILRLLTER